MHQFQSQSFFDHFQPFCGYFGLSFPRNQKSEPKKLENEQLFSFFACEKIELNSDIYSTHLNCILNIAQLLKKIKLYANFFQ